MRPTANKFVTFIASAATVTLMATWVRGVSTRDRVALPALGLHLALTTFPHHLFVDVDRGYPGMRGSVALGLPQYPSTGKYFEPRFVSRAGGCSLALPLWLPLLFGIARPAHQLARRIARRRDRDAVCDNCGYDLRASPARCPECGHPSPDASYLGVMTTTLDS